MRMHGIAARAIMLMLALSIAGCGPLPIQPALKSSKLDAEATPVTDLTVVAWTGSGVWECPDHSAAYATTFRTTIQAKLPATFEVNGVHVAAMEFAKKPIEYERLSNGKLALPLLDGIKTSHALVLIADGFEFQGKCGAGNQTVWVVFDAQLWDTAGKHPVWSAKPSLHLLLNQPRLRSRMFVASLLAGLHKEGLIRLKTGVPVDEEGKPITAEFIWADDR